MRKMREYLASGSRDDALESILKDIITANRQRDFKRVKRLYGYLDDVIDLIYEVSKKAAHKATNKNMKKMLYCSFCGKSKDEIIKLIAGPSVLICNECVSQCQDILREECPELYNE